MHTFHKMQADHLLNCIQPVGFVRSIFGLVDRLFNMGEKGLSQARVKSILSGDTLVLSAVNHPEQEKIFSLAYVSAPRLKREGDEVCATHVSPFAFVN